MADVKISQLPPASLPLAGTEVFPLVQNGVTVQAPVSGVGVVSTISALRGITPGAGTYTNVEGYYQAGDGGGGQFYGVTGGSYTDNGGTIITPNGATDTTAWVRIYSTPINVKWFGARGDNSADDTTKIQAAINYSNTATTKVVYLPAGTYLTSSPLRLFAFQSLVGESTVSTTILKTTTTVDTYGLVPARGGAVNDNYNVDSVVSIIHAANDFSRYNQILNLSLSRSIVGTSSYSIFAPRFAYATFQNVGLVGAVTAFFSYQLFLVNMTAVVAVNCSYGFNLSNDGTGQGGSTSLVMNKCYVNYSNTVANPITGYFFYGLNYSTLISCAVDNALPTASTDIAIAYNFQLCRAVNMTGCGAENIRGTVIQVQSTRSLTVNNLNAGPVIGAVSGTVAYRFFDNSAVTFTGCQFETLTSPGVTLDNIIQTGSNVTDINNNQNVFGGNAFVSYSGGSTWSKLASGVWTTQTSSTVKTAVYSTVTSTQTVVAAGSASVAGGGDIDTGVSGGLDTKYCFVQVRNDDNGIPTVAAQISQTYTLSGFIRVRFTKLSDGTEDFGTYTVNWVVLANS